LGSRVGHSLDKVIDMGAVVSEDQRKSIVEYVEGAREEGADVFQVLGSSKPAIRRPSVYPSARL
jgi:acyl-CoA reductase-like NAD-dependent aldehyde dehydrogenase